MSDEKAGTNEAHTHQWATDTHFEWGGGCHLVTYCTLCLTRSHCSCAEVTQ